MGFKLHISRSVLLICLLPCFGAAALASSHKQMVDGDAEPPAEGEFVLCTEPRPQICTQEHRPVCAELKDGSQKVYSNGCTSCSDPEVVGYRDGECEEEQ